MGKRLTPAQRVIDYVLTAPLEEVRQTLGTVKVILASREGVQTKARKAVERKRQEQTTVPANPPEVS